VADDPFPIGIAGLPSLPGSREVRFSTTVSDHVIPATVADQIFQTRLRVLDSVAALEEAGRIEAEYGDDDPVDHPRVKAYWTLRQSTPAPHRLRGGHHRLASRRSQRHRTTTDLPPSITLKVRPLLAGAAPVTRPALARAVYLPPEWPLYLLDRSGWCLCVP